MSEGQRAPELALHPETISRCVELMSAALPKEACALLVGTKNASEHRVLEVVSIPNIAEGRDAFQLDPLSWRQAELEARAAGHDVLGVWHSHPRASATPSAEDRANAQSGWSHAISSSSAPTRLRSYLCVDGALLEQRVTTLPQSRSARL